VYGVGEEEGWGEGECWFVGWDCDGEGCGGGYGWGW